MKLFLTANEFFSSPLLREKKARAFYATARTGFKIFHHGWPAGERSCAVVKFVFPAGEISLPLPSWQLQQANLVSAFGKNTLAMGKSILPTGKNILRIGKVILAIGKSILPTGKSFLPTGKIRLATGNGILPTRKIGLAPAKSFLPTGKTILPTGKIIFTTGKMIFTTRKPSKCAEKAISTFFHFYKPIKQTNYGTID